MLSDWRLLLIVLVGAFFRFYDLDWGEGYFFHPDEYHIAAAVGRLVFPTQMNPELFTYGSFTVYLIYFTRLLLGLINQRFLMISPILIGRFSSAFFSTLTIVVIYLIARKLFTAKNSLLAAALCAFMPGLIQQAHFTTPESTLTFWLFLTLYLWYQYWQERKSKFLYLSAISVGLALGTKIVALIFTPILFFLPLLSNSPSEEVDSAPTSEVARQRPRLLRGEFLVRLIKLTVLPLLIAGLTFATVFPYALLDWESFRPSMNYETGVGRGKPVVFYTRQFIDTPPLIFQLKKILPYALGPGILILGSLGFFLILRERRFWLVSLVFGVYFFSQAFLFAKWTRFIAPAFPFFAIFSVYFLGKISQNKILLTISHTLLAINLVWSLMFFSIYLRPDVRITATDWINQNLPLDSFILTEQGNMVEVPIRGNPSKTSFNFYGLEENPSLQKQLPELLVKADYFIVQSRRIFLNHQRLPDQFPITARFYDLLFFGQLGFQKIKEFNSFPQFSIFNFQFSIPDEAGEETWSVFDHPVIRIYQKTKPFTKENYETLLQI